MHLMGSDAYCPSVVIPVPISSRCEAGYDLRSRCFEIRRTFSRTIGQRGVVPCLSCDVLWAKLTRCYTSPEKAMTRLILRPLWTLRADYLSPGYIICPVSIPVEHNVSVGQEISFISKYTLGRGSALRLTCFPRRSSVYSSIVDTVAGGSQKMSRVDRARDVSRIVVERLRMQKYMASHLAQAAKTCKQAHRRL